MSNVVRLKYAYGVCPKCKSVHYLRYLIQKDGLIHKPYEIICINCDSYFAKEDIFGSGEETTPKPITNADRIRSMTGEELAEWLDNVSKAWYDEGCTKDSDETLMSEYPATASEWFNWLRQEVDE